MSYDYLIEYGITCGKYPVRIHPFHSLEWLVLSTPIVSKISSIEGDPRVASRIQQPLRLLRRIESGVVRLVVMALKDN
jgi:hypothetical protein